VKEGGMVVVDDSRRCLILVKVGGEGERGGGRSSSDRSQLFFLLLLLLLPTRHGSRIVGKRQLLRKDRKGMIWSPTSLDVRGGGGGAWRSTSGSTWFGGVVLAFRKKEPVERDRERARFVF